MGHQGQSGGPNNGRREGAASGATNGGITQPNKPADPADRPGASGHRFGPDLACSECGVAWDVHQGNPTPCKPEPAETVSKEDAFSRRPSGDFSTPASAKAE
ncbi:MAG: hypothetical protein AB8G23_13535 [Myxococcota bacterium]